MSRVHETGPDSRHDVEPPLVAKIHHLGQYFGRIIRIIERGRVFLLPPLEELGILDLNACRIGEHDRTEVAGCGGGENRTVVSRTHEKRQPPSVIDMRVAEHHRVDLVNRQREHLVLPA